MHIISQYNKLNGQDIYRSQIRKMINQAKLENIPEIVEKLTKILKAYPERKIFSLNVVNKVDRALKSELNGLEELNNLDDENGLDGVNPNDIYQFITDMILELINRKDDDKWEKPWSSSVIDEVYNYISEKPYRGINAVMLVSVYPKFYKKEWESPFFLTFKQIQALKGKLKKGSKGARVVYFTTLYSYENSERKVKINSYNAKTFISTFRKKCPDIASTMKDNQILNKYSIPILKYYNVFNASDVEGIPQKENPTQVRLSKFKENEIAEGILVNMPKKPKLKFGGNRAFYRPSTDLVQLPFQKDFKSPEKYYSTAFHEFIHSTLHPTRLDRKAGRKGTKEYAFEELIAELGASFLTGESGILNFHIKNTAVYLKGWASQLTKNLEEDNRFFFRASSKAQAAADFILDRDEKYIPKYARVEKKKVVEEKKIITPKKQDLPKKKQAVKKAIKPTDKLKVIKPKRKPKVGEQLALFGLKPHCDNPLVMSLSGLQIAQEKTPSVLYDIDGDYKRFLGNIEIKPFHSIAITLDAEQGAGKTRFVFQNMNHFASKGYKILFVSLEEHPQSQLFLDKIDMYISKENECNIDTVAELPNWYKTLEELIPYYDCIFIDSWNKIAEQDRKVDFDRDLRKKFNGKLFFTIFQRTTGGTMRGGAKAGFDGDVILRMEKATDFRQSYVIANKNRYQDTPLDQLRFSVYKERIWTEKEIEKGELQLKEDKRNTRSKNPTRKVSKIEDAVIVK